MHHNSIDSGPGRMIPFQVEVVDHLDPSTPTARTETLDGVIWQVLRGTPFTRSCWDAIELPDPELVVLCYAFGLYIPISYARADPIRAMGAQARDYATPETIPACIRRTARLRA